MDLWSRAGDGWKHIENARTPLIACWRGGGGGSDGGKKDGKPFVFRSGEIVTMDVLSLGSSPYPRIAYAESVWLGGSNGLAMDRMRMKIKILWRGSTD